MGKRWQFAQVDSSIVLGRYGFIHQCFRRGHRDGEIVACDGAGAIEPRRTQDALRLNGQDSAVVKAMLGGSR